MPDLIKLVCVCLVDLKRSGIHIVDVFEKSIGGHEFPCLSYLISDFEHVVDLQQVEQII